MEILLQILGVAVAFRDLCHYACLMTTTTTTTWIQVPLSLIMIMDIFGLETDTVLSVLRYLKHIKEIKEKWSKIQLG